MTEYGYPILWGRDTPALPICPNTYRPGMGWRDLTLAERDEARRRAGCMAYPVAPKGRALLTWFILGAAFVGALVLVGVVVWWVRQ